MRLDLRLKANMAARSLLLQACWNFQGMQNLGFAFAMLPGLNRIKRRGGPAAADGLKRHLEFFNTQPYMASFILGVACRLEEELAAAPPHARAQFAARISRLKATFGSALAGIGDAFFWATLRPLCAALAIWVWLAAWAARSPHPLAWALAVYLIVFNLPALWVRWRGIELGYRWGEGTAVELKRFQWQKRVRTLRGVGFALAVALALCALIVPPWGEAASPSHFAVLGLVLAVRHWGLPTPRIYAASLLVAFLAALAGA